MDTLHVMARASLHHRVANDCCCAWEDVATFYFDLLVLIPFIFFDPSYFWSRLTSYSKGLFQNPGLHTIKFESRSHVYVALKFVSGVADQPLMCCLVGHTGPAWPLFPMKWDPPAGMLHHLRYLRPEVMTSTSLCFSGQAAWISPTRWTGMSNPITLCMAAWQTECRPTHYNQVCLRRKWGECEPCKI